MSQDRIDAGLLLLLAAGAVLVPFVWSGYEIKLATTITIQAGLAVALGFVVGPAGLISLARGTASMFEGGAVTQTLVTMARGVLVIVAISDGSSLAVLAVVDADLDLVAYEMTVLAEQAGSVLTPDPRPPRAGQQA